MKTSQNGRTFIRLAGLSTDEADFLRKAASARGMTLAQYVQGLLKLHRTIMERASEPAMDDPEAGRLKDLLREHKLEEVRV